MSKRGETKLKGPSKDHVPTPIEPVKELLPHIRHVKTFTEPCAGDGQLVDLLARGRRKCAEAYDIDPRGPRVEVGDATTRVPEHIAITNPPYSRKLLMPILKAATAWKHEAWFLLPADVLMNKYFAEVAEHVGKVVPVGRVSWIRNEDGTPTGPGFENYAWVKIDAQKSFFFACRGQVYGLD